MLTSLAAGRVFLAVAPTDLRKSYDGLSTLVESTFDMDPTSGDLFVFLNRRQTQVRILYWERDGFCILMKRLEQGTFRRVKAGDGQVRIEIDSGDLALLLEGIDPAGAKRSKRYRKPREVSHVAGSCVSASVC